MNLRPRWAEQVGAPVAPRVLVPRAQGVHLDWAVRLLK